MSDTTEAANESMLAIAVDAAAAGHDLTGFEPVEDDHAVLRGYQAQCRRCGKTAWVGRQGVMYSLLAEICPNSGAERR